MTAAEDAHPDRRRSPGRPARPAHRAQAQPDLEVMAEANDGEEAVVQALAADVDLAILDISMPRMTGLQAAREITHAQADIRVLMLSMHDNEQYLFEAISAGASGYVLKTAADRDLVEACRANDARRTFPVPAGVRALMRDYLERARNGEAPREPLTPREEESSSSSPRPTPTNRSPTCWSSARRPSSATARTSSKARHARPRGADPLRDPPRSDHGVSLRDDEALPRSRRHEHDRTDPTARRARPRYRGLAIASP